MVPDKTLQPDVLVELEFEPSVNAAYMMGVAAKDGVITLTGRVAASSRNSLLSERLGG